MEVENSPLFSLNVRQFEQLLAPIVHRAVAEAVIKLQPAPVLDPPDEIFIAEVATITHRSKPTIYRLTAAREIPYSKRGKELVFSRKTILEWMEGRTVNVPLLAEEAADHLQKVASKR